ncbi:MAG: Hsp33 family molecular chaperone HslO [Bacilli bacterium]|nr:Hsp33 family molecular chaperone HslO [Bacilli bacterium]
MENILLKGLAYNKQVRIYVVRCEKALNNIGKRLNYYPSSLAAVGRVLAFTAMMGGMLKLDETVTVKVEGNGPIGVVIADADAHGHVRAYATNPYCHFEYTDQKKLNVRDTIGNQGLISVIKDLKLKEPFVGTIPIINGELGEDFAYYLAVSEQVPSVVSLGVLVNENNLANSAGGFIIQLLPNTSEEVIADLERKVNNMPTISEMFSSGFSVEDIARNLGDETFEIIEEIPVVFKCTCSKRRFAKGIMTLGKDEIQDMIDKEHGANTVCHFCGKEYNFTEEELIELKNKIKK